jgi:BirA family transcriptional regulator, biotin operon repressor / biotin---[acetyl-CoA-carboxylase] ligase
MLLTKTPQNTRWQLPAGVAFEWHEQIDSTSSELMRRARAQALERTTVIAAHQQSAGRGRMGRGWVSAAGDTLMFSLAYAVPAKLPLAGLSLALGVSVAQALNELLAQEQVLLKWPNDLLIATEATDASDTGDESQFKKLGGLLVESVPFNRNRNGALVAERWLIIGLGINLHLAQDHPFKDEACALDSVWHRPLAMSLPQLGGVCATALYKGIQRFEPEGFGESFHAQWQALHAFQLRRVRFSASSGEVLQGTALGVDSQGQLMIEADFADNADMTTKTTHLIASTEGQLRLC